MEETDRLWPHLGLGDGTRLLSDSVNLGGVTAGRSEAFGFGLSAKFVSDDVAESGVCDRSIPAAAAVVGDANIGGGDAGVCDGYPGEFDACSRGVA